MKAVVISGGQRISEKRALELTGEADLIICADKGAEYAADYGVSPHIIMGDMDSIDKRILLGFKNTEIIIYPKEKDYTDTQIAVMKAIELGAKEITLICATGLRSDHALANIRLLIHMYENNVTGKIEDDENTIYLCTGKTTFNNEKGKTISLLALSDKTEGITLRGFKYSLENISAGLKWTTGISNEIVSDYAEITVEKGKLIIFEII